MARRKKQRRSAWGSVIYRKDRGWYAVRVPVDGENDPGKRTKYRVYPMPSKQAAEDKLKELRGLHDAGRLVVTERNPKSGGDEEDGRLGLLGAVDEYIKVKRAEGKAEKTLACYASIRNRLADPASPLRGIAASDVTPDLLELYREWRRETVFRAICRPDEDPYAEQRPGSVASNATVNRDLTLVAAALNRLVKLRRMDENPAARVEKAREQERARVPLADNEAQALLSAADPEFRLILLTGFLTGARKEEILGLTRGDLDLDGGFLILRRSKTKNATRIPLPPELVEALKAHFGERIVPPAEKVFSLSDVRSAWNRAMREAGLEGKRGVTFHSTRHTFATSYLARGGNVYDLKEILGHADIATTMKYLHGSEDRIREAMGRMGFGGTSRGNLRTQAAYPAGKTGTDGE